MIGYNIHFFGSTDKESYNISYILTNRRIKHEFIFSEFEKSLVIETVAKRVELLGVTESIDYLENYRYYYDFMEI